MAEGDNEVASREVAVDVRWSLQRRRVRSVWILLLGGPVVVVGANFALGLICDQCGMVAAVVWILFLLVRCYQVLGFRCPRCGEQFYIKGSARWGGKHCLHCGIRFGDVAKAK